MITRQGKTNHLKKRTSQVMIETTYPRFLLYH